MNRIGVYVIFLAGVACLFIQAAHQATSRPPAVVASLSTPASPPMSNAPAAPPKTAPAAATSRMNFGGYPCGDDCSQHQAGYRWAEKNGIRDPDSCEGFSGSFIEGCRVYAEKRRAAATEGNT